VVLQVNVYVVVVVGVTVWVPLSFWLPVQPPLAVQFVKPPAFDQVNVAL
jgi:hypothetical protein